MFFTILAITLALGVTGLSYYALKKEFFNNDRILRFLSIFLITYKVIEIGYGMINGNLAKYPVEFSTIFYFFFPIVILTRNKRLLGPAVSGAFISGAGYLVYLVFSINKLMAIQQGLNNMSGFFIGMLSHSILYFLAIMYMARQRFSYSKDVILLNAVTIAIAIHASLMAKVIPSLLDASLLILLITTGDLIPFFQNKGFWMMATYFIIVWLLYNLTVYLVYKVNNNIYDKFHVKKEIQEINNFEM